MVKKVFSQEGNDTSWKMNIHKARKTTGNGNYKGKYVR